MPCVNIKAKKTDKAVDLKSLARELSEKTGITKERINVIVDFYDRTDFFSGGKDDQIIVMLYISETNDNSAVKHIMQAIAAVTGKHFGEESVSTAVVCNVIKEGFMYLNKQFK
ncbi:MAG TPA: hypothetical protein PLV37_04660 [Bacillota bacterium]|nr:hypothetical protein [Bacillota bacterium]